MRNDAQDDFANVPTLKAVERDDDEFAPLPHPRTARKRAAQAPMVGPLWALLGASFIALGGVAWWSFQQISLMEQQLVATQESFARISEDAAGRLQAISGKVSASETSAMTENEALKLQVRQLQASLSEQGKQQDDVAGQAGELGKGLEQVMIGLDRQQATSTQLQTQLAAVAQELTALKAAQLDGGRIEAQIKAVADDVAALKAAKVDGGRIDTQLKNQAAATQRLEQDLIVLKSEQENRPAPAAAGGGTSTAEFDAFRGQITRSINTLQSQVQNLQQQINARH